MTYQTPTGTWQKEMDRRLLIRADGRVERVCEHGVGHPVGHVRRWVTWMSVHGCDGCCATWAEKGTSDAL